MRPEGFSDFDGTSDGRSAKYGFHATLKAPFMLAPATTKLGLSTDFAKWRVRSRRSRWGLRSACRTGVSGGGFAALTPEEPPPALAALERAVVEGFGRWRAPLTPADRSRRKPEALSVRQRDYPTAMAIPMCWTNSGST